MKSKRLIAYICATAMMLPIGVSIQSVDETVCVSAEDTTTAEDVELVNSQVPSPAEDFTFNTKTYTITKYTGSDTEVVIPKSINGVPVRAIGGHAFCNSSIIKITIPNTISSIEDRAYDLSYSGAFAGAKALKEIVFEENSILSYIGFYAFRECVSIKNIEFPSSLTSIGERAFYGCTALNSINLNSVSAISEYAFVNCSSLMNIDFGDSLTTISSYAFAGCSSIGDVVIPNTIKTIGSNAFSAVSSLGYSPLDGTSTATGVTSLTLPEGIEIGEDAFNSCKLSKVTIKDGSIVGDSAFRNCSKLSEITIEGNTAVGSASFYNCNALRKATISKEATLGYNCLGEKALLDVDNGDNIFTAISNGTYTGLVVYGYNNSNAQTYSKEHNIPFIALDGTSEDYEPKYDINDDGEINLVDLMLLKKKIFGLIK